ncbi:MAG: hypothetical protein IPH04_08575 [Saprospirales bacterium]|nr:hypothetical protein [Saprospirales bacterium]
MEGANDLYLSFREVDGSWTGAGSPGARSIGQQRNDPLPLRRYEDPFLRLHDRPGSEGVDVYFSQREDTG